MCFFLRCTQHLFELTKAADFLFLEIHPTYSSFPFRSAVECSSGAITDAGLLGQPSYGQTHGGSMGAWILSSVVCPPVGLRLTCQHTSGGIEMSQHAPCKLEGCLCSLTVQVKTT